MRCQLFLRTPLLHFRKSSTQIFFSIFQLLFYAPVGSCCCEQRSFCARTAWRHSPEHEKVSRQTCHYVSQYIKINIVHLLIDCVSIVLLNLSCAAHNAAPNTGHALATWVRAYTMRTTRFCERKLADCVVHFELLSFSEFKS